MAAAAEVRVAVAANFVRPAEAIVAAFSAATGDRVILSSGATGALYTQIVQGAPFEVFLAADDVRPARAVAEGLGVEGSVVTYAVGRLALYSPVLEPGEAGAVLRGDAFAHLAIAAPANSPYGAAAMQVIEKMEPSEALRGRLVTGESIAQTLNFVESGNAELGFVALSQVTGKPAAEFWLVPAAMHEPIAQDAVLLTAGAENPAARAFLAFLGGPEAAAIMAGFGYERVAE